MSAVPLTAGLEGFRVLVTGAGRGIGRAVAEHLRASGAAVFAVDLDTDGLEKLAADTGVLVGGCDVSDDRQVDSTVGQAVAALGGLDGVVNSAGIVAVTRGPATTVGVPEFDRVMAVNVRGPWLLYRAAAAALAASETASIVNLASETAMSGSSNLAHYVASKAAVIGLTRALARESGPAGIRVNAVAPGYTDTEGARGIGDPDRYDTSATPLGRVGMPSDVVGVVAFLLSPASAFISGQTLMVNGGRVMG